MTSCTSACCGRMLRQSSAFSAVLTTLLVALGAVHSAPTPQWNPGFQATQEGGQVVVAIYWPYTNATAYKLMLTHGFSICETRIISYEEVGKRIRFDVPVNKCGEPVRVKAIALTKGNKELTDIVEILLPTPAPAVEVTSTTTRTKSETTGPPSNRLAFTLLVCVLAAVVIIAAVIGFLFFRKRVGAWCHRWPRGRVCCNNYYVPGPSSSRSEMHPIYHPSHDTVTVMEELVMELLCAHANVRVKPYWVSDDEIRSNSLGWVQGRMELPCIFFRSPGLSREGLSTQSSDHYDVVNHALAILQNNQDADVIEVDVIIDEPSQHIRDGSNPRLVLNLSQGADVKRDFERLVEEIHGTRNYPVEQMEKWWDCCIFKHLLEQISCRHNNVEINHMERVSCRCRTEDAYNNREFNQEANALLNPTDI